MLRLETENVVQIGGDLYPKTQESLDSLLLELEEMGYMIENLRQDEYRLKHANSVEQMEKEGWSLWYARIDGIRFGKCEFCKSYINTAGIRLHGHKCECCGKVVYLRIIDGSIVRFRFLDMEKYPRTGYVESTPDLNMKAHHWDTENGYLYLYPAPLDGGWGTVTGKEAESYLNENRDKWEMTDDGLMKIEDHLQFDYRTAKIEHCDIMGHESHVEIVKLWKGKEYKEYDRLPVPEYMSIFEPWHWMPLHPSPQLHERLISAVHMVSDQGYYYQDGRPAFGKRHFDDMATFIEHFTLLDAEKFRNSKFRLDGPGAIADLATFCYGDDAQVTNKPNIGNVLVALGKGLEGKHVSEQEMHAAVNGLKDPETRKFFHRLRKR